MPFDGSENPELLARLRLIEALRSEMPRGFTWNFSTWHDSYGCGTAGCACGLALEIGLVPRLWTGNTEPSTAVGRAIGLHANTARGIFCPADPRRTYGVEYTCAVTPVMVADALERTLSR
jgi:hypothetical protein